MSRFSPVALCFFLLLAPLAFTKYINDDELTPNDEAYIDPSFVNGDPSPMEILSGSQIQPVKASSPDWMKRFTTDAASPTSLQHYATPGQMLDATADFERVYRGLAFLFLLYNTNLKKPYPPEALPGVLHSVCQMFVYRLGASTPIRAKVESKEGSYLKYYLSLSQEKVVYDYLRHHRFINTLLTHFLEGRMTYYSDLPKEWSLKVYESERGNSDDIPFYTLALGLYDYLPYWKEADAFQAQHNALYRQYTQKLCAPNNPLYQDILQHDQKYLSLFLSLIL